MVKKSLFSEYSTQRGNAFLKTFITDEFSFFLWVYESDCCMQYMSLFEICFNYRRDVYVFYRIEFDLLYKLTFIGRKNGKHLIGSNH